VSPSPSGSSPADLIFAVTEASQVGEARRRATELAEQSGFDGPGAARVALVVAELAGNLAKHARDGELLVRPLKRAGVAGIEVLALDRGPGMADVERCLSDGYSTAGSPGTGLGAVARLAESLDIFSNPQVGTALLARLWSRPVAPAGVAEPLVVAAVCVPKSGESECGDAWVVEPAGSRGATFLVADGLGHGPGAAAAARQAAAFFRANVGLGSVGILRSMHLALRSTRGAAVAVAEIDLEARLVRFAGVGNISGIVLSEDGGTRSVLSHNGTVGHVLNKLQEFVYPFPQGALLVLYSDGLGTRWDLATYPGLAARDPGLIAGVLYRDFKRGRDDVTVLAVREERR
jgi:anti-sigma regulatory factor (Ser/Thr protein kinase)